MLLSLFFNPPEESARLQRAREEQEINDIFFYGTVKQWLAVMVPVVLLVAIVIVSYSWGQARIKKASVHMYKNRLCGNLQNQINKVLHLCENCFILRRNHLRERRQKTIL